MHRLWRLRPYIWRYRRRYAAGTSIMLLAAVLAALTPVFLQMGVDALDQGASMEVLLHVVFLLVTLALLRGLFLFRGRFSIISTSRFVEYDLRNDVYRHLLRLPASFFDSHKSGDLASRVINDLEGIRMIAGIGVQIVCSTSFLFLLSLSMMFYYNAKVASICLIPLVLLIGLTSFFTRRLYDRSRAVQDRLADISNLAQENFSGSRVIRAFSQETAEERKFAEASTDYKRANLTLAWTRGGLFGMITFFVEAALVVTVFVGGGGIIEGTFTKGEMAAFIAYVFLLLWPVIAIGWMITLLQRGAACMSRLAEILDTPPDEEAEPSDLPPPSEGAIEIRDLTFRYSREREPALQGVSFRVAPGERVAVVGRTGSGKSTLIQILLGLYRIPSGHVFIDGRDINEYSRRALRSAIGSVPQDTFLFSDRISENISFGGRNGVTDEMITEAAEISRIAEDARGFPDGLDQIIGERGITLSGGQKQRTAIARAVIRRPRILLLDDALSSVDVHTEHEIIDGLGTFLKDRTSLMVTHRFSLVQKVDRVLVMENGRIVESGTHEELMRIGGIYAMLVERQRLSETLSDQ